MSELTQKVTSSYERKDANLLLGYMDWSGTPAEIRTAVTESMRSMWGAGNLVVRKVDVHAFADYQPTTDVPGEFGGRKLKWSSQPTHWIVLQADAPPGGRGGVNLAVNATFELAVSQKGQRWFLAGATYSN